MLSQALGLTANEAIADGYRTLDRERRIQAGGYFVYVGAGALGRLVVLGGMELKSTLPWHETLPVQPFAGSPGAVWQTLEAAEDDAEQGEPNMKAVGLNARAVKANAKCTLLAEHAGTVAAAIAENRLP